MLHIPNVQLHIYIANDPHMRFKVEENSMEQLLTVFWKLFELLNTTEPERNG